MQIWMGLRHIERENTSLPRLPCVAQKRFYLNKLPPGSLPPSTCEVKLDIDLAGLLPVTSIEMEGLCCRTLLLNFSYGNSIPGSTGQVYQNQALLGGKSSETSYAITTRGAEIAPSLCGAERE